MQTERSKLTRGSHEKRTIYRVLDAAFLAHVDSMWMDTHLSSLLE